MDKIEVRLATEHDYQALLEMSQGHFNGHDSTPSLFHGWLKRADHRVFIATLNDKAIGFSTAHIIDSGATFITKGTRIHPQFRSRGYGTQFILEIRRIVSRDHPTVVRERYITSVKSTPRIAIAKKTGDKLLRKLDSYAFLVNRKTFDVSTLVEASQCPELSRIRPYTREEFKTGLSSPQYNLFKEEVMALHSIPYEATPCNVDIALEPDISYMFGGTSDSMLSCLESFSHGVKLFMPTFQSYRVSVFAEDSELFRAHIIQQLLSACRVMDDEFVFRVSHDEDSALKRRGLEFLETKLGLEREAERYYAHNDSYKSLLFESEDLHSPSSSN